jgi:hypothetical protein
MMTRATMRLTSPSPRARGEGPGEGHGEFAMTLKLELVRLAHPIKAIARPLTLTLSSRPHSMSKTNGALHA